MLTVTNTSDNVPPDDDHMITKNVDTRQGAVAMDPTRKGPPPVPTRASSTALTDEQRKQQQRQQQQQHDVTTVKVPPKIAKKPKANKRPPEPQASTGNHSYFLQLVNYVMYQRIRIFRG